MDGENRVKPEAGGGRVVYLGFNAKDAKEQDGGTLSLPLSPDPVGPTGKQATPMATTLHVGAKRLSR
jgi:hypothetical protein